VRPRTLALAAGVFLAAFFGGRRALSSVAFLLNAAVVLHLALVTFRRASVTLAALAAQPKTPPAPATSPRLTVLVPCRNEAAALPATLKAWDDATYPRDRLELIFIDDASTDATPTLLSDFVAARVWARLVTHAEPAGGKGDALAAGLAAAAPSDAVAVFDADARPAPGCLAQLVAALTDTVVAVAGRMLPEPAGPAAVYSAAEAAVHQRLTITGAARLGGVTPLLGSAYLVRRATLDRLGFATDHRLEDIDLTARLLIAGERIAWAPAARCTHLPPADRAALGTQRIAWSRGFHRVTREHAHELTITAPHLPAALDRLLFFTGYLDRLSLVAALILAALAHTIAPALWLPWWFLALVVALPVAQIPVAVLADRWPPRRLASLPAALVLAAVDVLSEWQAVAADLLHRPQPWRRADRATPGKTP
jgi:cellulose synthase/poly-beta-1,6-N-acetylglucosamine synthase-like glycosyltransferase